MLEIDKEKKDGVLCFNLVGELDMHTGEVLDNSLQNENMVDIKKLVFSLNELGFIDSTGIGQLIRYYREYVGQGIEVVVDNKNDEIEEVLELIGLRQIIQGG
ncbi:MAG TPA: STAS domain-containing protein [Clostridia bacterium]|nr:STAS domain-containing protein [Clostridia bacterium]